jgi:hypothetical protein
MLVRPVGPVRIDAFAAIPTDCLQRRRPSSAGSTAKMRCQIPARPTQNRAPLRTPGGRRAQKPRRGR